MRTLIRIAVCCLLALPAGLRGQAHAASETLEVFRCIDAKGKTSLQDTPCPAGSRQETMRMARPVDAPPPVIPSPAPAAVPVIVPVEPPVPLLVPI